MVVATLLHDIGDDLAPMNHSQYAASILRPYVSEKTYWIIQHHGLFQTYYSAHHLGGDRNARDKFKIMNIIRQQLISVKIMIKLPLILIIKV
jgi:predicted HD phosphohydrolase